jgi:N-acetyl-anhydromuramyl-L-alanine amidase AmpD
MDDPERRWADTGQNFTVTRGGLVLEGRSTSLLHARAGFVVRGAHAGTDEGNRFYFGVEVEGRNLPSFEVTDPQWDALAKLCAWLSLAGNFQSSSIEGHGHFVATQCPGKLMDHLDRLRAQVRSEKVRLMGEVA